MQRFKLLETVIRRAPLAMRFVDIVRDVTVNDSLLVQAWQKGVADSVARSRQMALVSPLSGVYGFRSLPGLARFEAGIGEASDWYGPQPDAPAPDDWASSGALYGWANTAEGVAIANFVITVEDLQERFLPEMLFLYLPREHLLEVPLISGPARPPLAGFGVIRGQLARHDSPQMDQPLAAGWATVTAILDGRSYESVADARGIFVIFVPYARFPALQNGGSQQGGDYIARLVWDVTIQVSYQPSQLIFVPSVEQPDMRSIITQGRAGIYQQADHPASEFNAQLPFGKDLVVTTEGQQSLLFVDPALP